jgi:hypothetical protein
MKKFFTLLMLLSLPLYMAPVAVAVAPAATYSWTAPTLDTNGGTPSIDHWIVSWSLSSRGGPPLGSIIVKSTVLVLPGGLPIVAPCGTYYFTVRSVTTAGAVSASSAPLPYVTGTVCAAPLVNFPAVAVTTESLQ